MHHIPNAYKWKQCCWESCLLRHEVKELAGQAPAMLGVSAVDWSRVVVNSPEGALGPTYRHVHFVAVRTVTPGIPWTERGGGSISMWKLCGWLWTHRRVAVSRATHSVTVYVEDMRAAREAETRQLQQLQRQQWLDLSGPTVRPSPLIAAVAKFLQEWKAKQQKRPQAAIACDFFADPALQQEVWSYMVWSLPRRRRRIWWAFRCLWQNSALGPGDGALGRRQRHAD